MDFYTMTTIAGARSYFVYDDNVITQDSFNSIDVEVETVVIEFNQAAFEEFFRNSVGSA